MRNKIIYLLKSLLFKRAFFGLLLLIASSYNTKAQSGANDPTFDPGTGANDMVRTTVIQSDGKILIGGGFTSYNGTSRNCIARLNADGTLDATFNPGTGVNGFVITVVLQSDGKIIISGNISSYNGNPRISIVRLNTDGTLDASFDPNAGAGSYLWTTAIQSDGKILIGGVFYTDKTTTGQHIVRLNADGTLDSDFNPGTGANSTVITTAIQNDGKIIIGGDFTSYNGTTRNRIARLNTDGTLDATFNPGSGANSYIYTTAIQSDGKIIIGGDFTSYNGTPRNRIARLNTDGTLDATFNPGTGAGSYVITTAIQSDGKIVIGGDFTSYNGATINRIARLNTNGTLDATFNPGTGANYSINTTAIQSNGKIVIGGSFTSYNGIGRNSIARILGTPVGIGTIQPKAISIYPNPVSNELNIEIEGNKGQVNFEILNLFGQVVFNGNMVEKTTVQISNFATGVYLIKVVTDKGFEIKKIIKE